MNSCTFYLRGEALLELAKRIKHVKNLHQVSQAGNISYPTALQYIAKPEKASFRLDLKTLYNFLTNGLNFTGEDLAKLTLLDVFAIIDSSNFEILAAGKFEGFDVNGKNGT